ncbi:hypothetical protein GIB67_018430 [Kingdonia uniflora]|uniref:RNase H type-1 domain-containing protein n=1 Tax=Kingdonia uniflora TaxID=39325 RepID=A0A7J7LJH9_9MAGN|nr:hypothetical protein GIB67_018430 [Kingdonia uniflora]
MVTYKNIHSPSHLLFADDILIFANGDFKGMKALKILMEVYQSSSSQWVNKQKCKILAGSISPFRLKNIATLFGFGVGTLPEKYLGIPLVQGRVSKATVAPLIDNIRSRASGWSGKLLSFQSRVVLVKSILTSLPIYSMAIYKWPIAAVKEGKRIIRNFLWFGDPVKKKFLIIKWAKVCKHPSEGGIGIKSLKDINIAMLMKLGWAFLNDHESWAKFLRAKFLNKEGLLTQYYKNSSIWTGLKEAIATFKAHSKWIIGSDKDIDLCRDCWGSDSAIYDLLEIPDDIWKYCTAKLSQIIHHNSWSAPPEVVELLGSLGIDLNGIILNSSDKDIRVGSTVRTVSSQFIVLFNIQALTPQKFGGIPSHTSRNAFVFEGFSHSINDIKRRSLVAIKDAASLSCNSMANNCLELSIVAALGVPIKARPLPRIQSTTWALPWFQEVKINCGAATIGTTGKAGVGAAARNHLGDVIGVLTKGLDNTTLFFSECEAILGAIDWAVQNNWKKIWIESDSQTAISDFTKNHVPWPQRARWNRMKTSFEQIRFSHC